MEIFFIIPAAIFFGYAGFNIGQYSKSNPTEAEMMQRLIQARLGRKMAQITSNDLEREIEAASDRLAHAKS